MAAAPTPERFAARFWARVDRSAGHGPNGDCWLWTGALFRPTRTSTGGYGHLSIGRKDLLAHRVAYELMKGDIPDGLVVMHRCDVRACCNPDHLSVGTKADNTADMMAKGRHRTAPHRTRQAVPA